MHTQRLIQLGITDSKHKIFKVNEGLTKITHKHFKDCFISSQIFYDLT